MLLNPQPLRRAVSIAGPAILGVLLSTTTGAAPIAAVAVPADAPTVASTALPRRPVDAADAASRLAGLLHLDDAQKARVQEIFERERVALDRMWHDSTLPIVEKAIASKTQHERTVADIRAVLNPAQAAVFAKLTQSRADNARETATVTRPTIQP
jgi:Spy/CpxP family protein refolding chaperone